MSLILGRLREAYELADRADDLSFCEAGFDDAIGCLSEWLRDEETAALDDWKAGRPIDGNTLNIRLSIKVQEIA